MAHLGFAHETDLEFVAEAPAGGDQGQMKMFTDCDTCGRRWSIRPESKRPKRSGRNGPSKEMKE